MANENEKVVLLRQDEQIQPSKWSFRRYGLETWHYKWWVLGFTLGCGLAGFLGFKLVLNPSKTNISSSFNYQLPTLGTQTSGDFLPIYIFLDGNKFALADLKSTTVLQTVKDSKEDYKNIDVEKLSTKISLSVAGYTDADKQFIPYTNGAITISANYSLFPNEKTAKSFFKDLLNVPVVRAAEAVNTYTVATKISSNFSSLDFSRRVDRLSEVYYAVSGAYNSLISSYSESHRTVDGTTLGEARRLFLESHYEGSTTDINQVSDALIKNNYVFYDFDKTGGEREKIIEFETRATSNIDVLKEQISKINQLQEDYDRLLAWQGIASDKTSIADQIVETSNKISSTKDSLTTYLKELKKIGYECNALDEFGNKIDIMDVRTLDQVNKIALSETTYGYIQYLTDALEGKEVGLEWKESCKAYRNRLDNLKTLLDSDLDLVNKYFRTSTLSYSTKAVINEPVISGNISSAIGALIGVLGGFVVTSLICTAVGIGKEKSEEEKELKATK